MKNILKVKRCLISVSDKTNITNFAENLTKKKIEIISTGNTYKVLRMNGISVKKVSSITGFPEVLDGRVKTLHPKIFGGILGDTQNSNHKSDMKRYNLKKFDLVIVNLYPFETVTNETKNLKKCIENIDIGGPSMIRAAAKNYSSTAIIVDIKDYEVVLKQINQYQGISLQFRKELALKAFTRTMHYDASITNWIEKRLSIKNSGDIFIKGNKIANLRYGENPQQRAAIYSLSQNRDLFYEQLNGKELSYNNLNDLNLGLKLITEFNNPTCVVVKHSIPSSVSESKSINLAWKKAFSADSLSAFGGIVVFNKTVDEKLANELNKVFLELVVAPNFSKKAINIFSKKNSLRVLKVKNMKALLKNFKRVITMLPESILAQDMDNTKINKKSLKVVSKKTPSDTQIEDLLFACKVVKHVKSNAIVIAKNKTTIGIGSGNTSRVDSVQFAIIKAKRSFKGKSNLKGAVLASDAFFHFPDSIKLASKANIASIIQPGGSVNDEKVINQADIEKISMAFTGKRSFSH
ncbi:MAG: bifunctional phosphoribosylaminoimidazolecarboxamide formyltransferase/IMP cyclohydrolase [Pseudomonadota bacterium]|nr:bifunctional phosphoribosylaminoimidazolecarboxamide formyltransferase/IMP cyclohydrolase [Pseudomonadota bacterium]